MGGVGENRKRNKSEERLKKKDGEKKTARLAMLSSCLYAHTLIVASLGALRLSLPLLPSHGSSYGMEMRLWVVISVESSARLPLFSESLVIILY